MTRQRRSRHRRPRTPRSPLPCPPPSLAPASTSPPPQASARPTSPTPHPYMTAPLSSCPRTPVPSPRATSAPTPPPANPSAPPRSADQRRRGLPRTVPRCTPMLSRSPPRRMLRLRLRPLRRTQLVGCRHSSLTFPRPNRTSRTSVARPRFRITTFRWATRPYLSSMAPVMLRCLSCLTRTSARCPGRSAAIAVDPLVARVRCGQANLPCRSLTDASEDSDVLSFLCFGSTRTPSSPPFPPSPSPHPGGEQKHFLVFVCCHLVRQIPV
jgi:hypothetical protein